MKIEVQDINKYDLNEDDLKQIVTNITMKYQYDINTKVKQDIIKEDIQEAINQYTIQKRRDSIINQILNDEPTTIHNNRINLTINIDNSMLD
jgi:ethanolamine ammonia-lyase large subunit